MLGIELDRMILYKYSSLRYFKEGEHHTFRFCQDDVLLLVFEGVLRFLEDGVQYELHPGEYHIQRHNSYQEGPIASDAPKYLYVHFSAEWAESETALPRSGVFEYAALKGEIEELDRMAHSGAPYIAQAGKFYGLLTKLYRKSAGDSVAEKMASYIAKECHQRITLETLCETFHFSKNHIINLFKKAFGMTPIAYINQLRLQNAEYRMEVTSDSLETISAECGFQNYSHFYKLFIRKNSLSPEKWRESRRLR